ncbi:MAG: M50 family metallopeptidase [Chloroflexi bacterium]|nr:M50 family metallopeptidase [Chloroflexota bacterium]
MILLASIVWMVGGIFITSGAFEDGQIGGDVADGIQSLASGLSVGIPADFPLPLLFLVTGLPLALVSLLFLRRRKGSPAKSESESAAPNLRRQTIVVTVLALIVALLIWNIQDVERVLRQSGVEGVEAVDDLTMSVIGYPVRLFVTFVHEAGHSLAALLTGGRVSGFEVDLNGSGRANVSGGSIALIAPAGYLGAALFGSLLFFLTNRIPKWTRGLSFLVGLAIIALTLAYAMPSGERDATALIIGIGFGVGLIALGWFAPRIVNVFVLNTLAILTGLNAVFDVWHLVLNPGAGTESAVNDAVRFSSDVTPLLPPAVVAFMWAVIAVAMLAFAMYFGLIKQVRGELAEVVNGKTESD